MNTITAGDLTTVISPHGSITHHYGYDNQHRLTHYRRMQNGNMLTEGRYAYDPLGRRISKQVWQGEAYDGGWYVPTEPAVSVWYGQDGNRLTTMQTDKSRIQTVYLPGGFTPLLRVETATAALEQAVRRTLAEKLQQGADGKPVGAGTHPGEENPSLPLRPPGAAAGAHR